MIHLNCYLINLFPIYFFIFLYSFDSYSQTTYQDARKKVRFSGSIKANNSETDLHMGYDPQQFTIYLEDDGPPISKLYVIDKCI